MQTRIYFLVYSEDQSAMIDTAQKRALRKYRRRRARRGTAQFDAASELRKKSSTLTALRRSPLVRSDLNLARSRETGRKVDF
jgi:hypothetical protein